MTVRDAVSGWETATSDARGSIDVSAGWLLPVVFGLVLVFPAGVVGPAAAGVNHTAGPAEGGGPHNTGVALSQTDTATVDTNADIDDDGRVDELAVRQATGQAISGTTTAPAGTELDVIVTGTDSGSPFVKPLTATVQSDGSWATAADFSANPQGANFSVRVERDGASLLDEPVDGRITDEPTGSVSFSDQESGGDAVTVSSVTLSDGGFVAIHLDNASGTVVGSSDYIEAGSASDIPVSLNEPLSEDTTLVAMAHQDTDRDETYAFEFGSSVDAPYMANGSAVTDSAEITVPAAATVDTNADIDDDGQVDEFAVRQAAEQTITGTTTAPDGTELDVIVTGTDSGSPFVKPLTATVQSDGSWATTADFSGNPEGANFTVQVERDGASLLDEPVDGRIGEAPTASVTVADQTSDGSAVTVSSVTLSDGGFVAIHRNNASGTVVGSSDYIEAGSASDVEIALDTPFDGDATVVAMPHQDTDGDETYEFEFGSSVDAPYTANGSAVTDSAEVSVASATAEPPNVSVSITGTNAPIAPGDTLDVTADVTNVGGTSGTQQLTLSTDDGTTVDQQSVTLSAGETTTMTLSWPTDADATGERTVTVASANDSDSRTVTVERRDQSETNGSDANDSSVANDDSYSVWINESLVVEEPGVLGNDADGDNLSASLVRGPSNGTVSLLADGSFTYRPDEGFTGTDSLTYEVTDGDGMTDTATVTISVTRPTFAVTNVTSNAPVEAGDPLTVTATVANRGPVADSQSLALVGPEGTTVDTTTVTLEPNASTVVTLRWETSSGDAVDAPVTLATATDEDSQAVVVRAATGTGNESDGRSRTPDATDTPTATDTSTATDTPTATETNTSTTASTPNGTTTPAVTSGSGPGFGVVTVLAAVLASVALGRRRS